MQFAKHPITPLAIVAPVILDFEMHSREYQGRIGEIETSLFQRPETLLFIEFDLHAQLLT